MDNEISAKIIARIFSEILYLVDFSVKNIARSNFQSFLRNFRENYHRKSRFKFESRRCIYVFFVDQFACVSKKKGDNRRSFVVEEGPLPTCAKVPQQQQLFNSVRKHILRRAAPGRRSAVPSCSLSRHSGVFCFCFFQSSGGWVKIKLKLSHFHVSDTCVSI